MTCKFKIGDKVRLIPKGTWIGRNRSQNNNHINDRHFEKIYTIRYIDIEDETYMIYFEETSAMWYEWRVELVSKTCTKRNTGFAKFAREKLV